MEEQRAKNSLDTPEKELALQDIKPYYKATVLTFVRHCIRDRETNPWHRKER